MKKQAFLLNIDSELYSLPGTLFAGNYLYLTINIKTGAARVMGGSNPRFGPIIEEIESAGGLGRFYDLSVLRTAGTQTSSLLQKRPFIWHPFLDELYTLLPLTTLSAHRVKDDHFFGRISFNNIMPNLVTRSIVAFVYIDLLKDRMVGFNPYFFSLFSDRYKNPGQLLGKPANAFFSPTPSETQKEMIQAADLSLLPPKAASYREYRTPALIYTGFDWNSDVFTLPQAVDTEKEDFIVEAVFSHKGGRGPYLVVGNVHDVPGDSLDSNGYLLGHDLASGLPIVKKHAHPIAVGAAGTRGVPAGEHALVFRKTGNVLAMALDRKPQVAWHDNDFLHRDRARLTVGVRRNDPCTLTRVTLHAWPAGRPRQAPVSRHIIRLNGREDRFFTLERFFNHALAGPNTIHIGGFLLHDVTDMQGKIQRLDSQHRNQMKREARLQKLLSTYREKGAEFIGRGARMAALKEAARTAAATPATVLIEGPTGSGKEVLAHYIHQNSPRADRPLIKVDCATVPATLIESHLFGHEKGAFTGAHERSTGMFEKSDGGTLFLDEAGNLPLNLQAKLLQFFNDFTITRLGGTESVKLDVRCILASNEPLSAKVRAGTFREDLYFRINVVRLEVPGLSEHPEDIPDLALHFLDLTAAAHKKEVPGFSPAALQKLEAYAWPGNIRELRNVVERAVIFCKGDEITPEEILLPAGGGPTAVRGRRKKRTSIKMALSDRDAVARLLERHGGVVADAAREINVSRRTLYNYIEREKIDLKAFRKGYTA